ncbi:CHAT domain-containing protein [Portibacter lacus]|uniref:CHAT domain-containing protein n=1 Tax=Portibacter lacus TaxID=1099794 RepID=A0AA37SQ84_9BACT|nr:CHAT domain-containing protein [Portibacter lacus]GLR19006.1 hypothetical protein GCM10007940_36220 [Portibacter lacus]
MLRLLTLLLIIPINTYATPFPIHTNAAGIPIIEIQKILEESQSYIIYEEDYGILVNKDDFIVFPINNTEVHKYIDLIKKENLLFRKNPFNHQPDKFEAVMSHLYHLLIAPIKTSLQQSVHIIPSSSLSSIPWNALKNESNLYMVDQHAISIQKTINHSLQLPKRKVKTMVFAPQFTGSTYLNSKAEKETITKLFRETKNDMSHYDIIHISSHGKIDSSNWLDSGIFINNEHILRNRDIMSMCINAQLVFLNICNGGETNQKGKSIATAFQEAGAQTVVAALWEVEDQSAIKISKHFYEEIAQGEKPSEALQTALLTYRNEVELTSELNPFYWAGFQVYGENAAIIEELTYNMKRIISLVLSFLTSFSLLGYYYGGKIKGKLIEFNLV